MTRWVFTRRTDSLPLDGCVVNAAVIHAAWLLTLNESEVTAQRVETDHGERDLGELFRVRRLAASGEESEIQIVIEGDVTGCRYLGSEHDLGEFIIDGSAGDDVGYQMRGGRLVVHGDVRHGLGSMLRGGQIQVDGNAGDFVGGPDGSSAIGMRGGWIHVTGNVGRYAAHRMRRGCLTIGGSAGELVASQMIAGTVVIAGTLGDHAAYGMRRGTLVLAGLETLEASFPGPRFTDTVDFQTPFGILLARELASVWDSSRRFEELGRRLGSGFGHFKRGDRAVAGKGEIFVPG